MASLCPKMLLQVSRPHSDILNTALVGDPDPLELKKSKKLAKNGCFIVFFDLQLLNFAKNFRPIYVSSA